MSTQTLKVSGYKIKEAIKGWEGIRDEIQLVGTWVPETNDKALLAQQVATKISEFDTSVSNVVATENKIIQLHFLQDAYNRHVKVDGEVTLSTVIKRLGTISRHLLRLEGLKYAIDSAADGPRRNRDLATSSKEYPEGRNPAYAEAFVTAEQVKVMIRSTKKQEQRTKNLIGYGNAVVIDMTADVDSDLFSVVED